MPIICAQNYVHIIIIIIIIIVIIIIIIIHLLYLTQQVTWFSKSSGLTDQPTTTFSLFSKNIEFICT